MRGSVRTKGLSRLALGACALVFGCVGCGADGSVPGASSSGSAGMPASSSSLVDGAHLTASLTIPAGMMVTIPAGAKIVVDPKVTITVQGTLSVASATGPHAQIAATVPAPTQAQSWGGLVVDAGGDLEARGLDLAGALVALEVRGGAKAAHYDNGTIAASQEPFLIDVGGRLDTAHAAVTGAAQGTVIMGELHASYLDYQKAAFGGGLVTMSSSAVLDVTDSRFGGTPDEGTDYISAYAAALVHVAYSTIANAHCAFHFDDVTQFQIDHVTAGALSAAGPGDLDVYGAMLYGSGAGPNTISNSNFSGTEMSLDQQGSNGPITITNTYTSGGPNAAMPTWTWAAADVATAPIADAQPR
jgi:hypothetical protein